MTKNEALAFDLALEALREDRAWLESDAPTEIWEKNNEAITAIKQARSAPVQEPLEYWNAVEGWVKIDEVREHFDSVGCGTIYKTAGDGRVPLTAAPVQNPIGYADQITFDEAMRLGKGCDVWPVKGDYEQRTGRKLRPLYTNPPAAQRQRVVFPTMLRKMWSGSEVQAWLDENVNKENT